MPLAKIARRTRAVLANQFEILIHSGLKGYFDDYKNLRQLWTLNDTNSNNIKGPSSLSDTVKYNNICEQATSTDSVFSRFKSNRDYREILQHVSRKQGWEYLTELDKDPWVLKRLSSLVGDVIGEPFRYSYGSLGRISPTDLRYAKVLSDLHGLFGPLNNFRIAEIGSGYGGQALAIMRTFDISSYTLFDLPSAAKLAMKYIGVSSNFQECLIGDLVDASGNNDLIISNYAFSELRREIQEGYFEAIVKHSTRGYMIYNDLTPPEFNSITANELAARIPGAEIFQEVPLTAAANVLVVWGHNSKLDEKRFIKT